MTPTAKQPAQSSAAKIIINAEISFRRRVSSEAKQRVFTCQLARFQTEAAVLSPPYQPQLPRQDPDMSS
jgi:hypothetical protein